MPPAKTDERSCHSQKAAMLELRHRFILRCEERHSRMRDLVEDIQAIQLSADGAAVTDSIHEMQRLAHEITGGGGTFGCPKLSEIAAEMEAHLACCAAGKRRVDDVILLKYLDRLKSAIEMAGVSRAMWTLSD